METEKHDAHIQDYVERQRYAWHQKNDHVTRRREWMDSERTPKNAHIRDWIEHTTTQRDAHVQTRALHFKNAREQRFRNKFRKRNASPLKQMAEHARERIANHVISQPPVRSYRFTRPQGGSVDSFTLTWTPGVITMTGDLGELTLTHYNAAGQFMPALKWIETSDFDYLMGKSDAKEEYDRDETLKYLIEYANEEAFRTRLHELNELRRRRADAVQAKKDYRNAHTKWRREGKDPDAEPTLEDFLPQSEDYDLPRKFTVKKTSWASQKDDEYEIPEGFEQWHRLWKALDDLGEVDSDPNILLTAKGRHEVIEALENAIGDEHSAGEFCSAADISDYYGSRTWPAFRALQIEAIKFGVRAILQDLSKTDAQAPSAA